MTAPESSSLASSSPPSAPSVSPPLVMLPAKDLSALVQARTVSSREVMGAYLDHIERCNPAVNAIVSLQPREALLAAADAADAELAAGRSRGWLHGLPHAVKDLAATRGIRTTHGSTMFEDAVPAADAIFVERLRANGAIIIGKTNVPELGLGSHSYNPVFGVTRNPFDPSRSAGGSSGGAAAALALRLVPVADGSDFGGSLRNPAGWNNVFGFRPSLGRVPYGPTPEVFMQTLGYDGPMARTVGDLALLLSVIAGYDERAPLSLTSDPWQFTEPLARDVRGLRIGWLGDLGGVPMEAGILELCRAGLRRFEDAGCTVEEARLDVDREVIWRSFVTLRHGLMAGRWRAAYDDPARRAKLKPEAVWEIEHGLRLPAVDMFAASVQRTAVYQAFRVLLQRYDCLALPSAQVFPFDAALHWPATIAGVAMDSYHRWMEIVAGPSLAGCPTIAVPAGFGPGGLPAGLQLVGRKQQDFALLQLAHAYEQVSQSVLSVLPPMLRAPVG